MPLYMDRHFVEGATQAAVAKAHELDLAVQEKYQVKFLTYWFDEPRCTARLIEPVGQKLDLIFLLNSQIQLVSLCYGSLSRSFDEVAIHI